EEHFRGFRLKEYLSFRLIAPRPLCRGLAIEDRRDRVAVGDDLVGVPLAYGLLDVFFPAEALNVFPLRIACVPVDAAALELAGRCAGFVVRLPAAVFHLGGEAEWVLLVAKNQEIAGAAFDHLALDGRHPGAMETAIRALAVDQDAAIPCCLFARR